MTRTDRRIVWSTIGVALLVGAGTLVLLLTRRHPIEVVEAPPPGIDPPSTVTVWMAEDATRVVLLKRRFAEPARSAFTDRSLGEVIDAGADRHFVEWWVVNRGDGDLQTAALTPELHGPGSGPIRLEPLPIPAGARSAAGPLLAALGAPDTRPLGKMALRRIVYALPAGTSYDEITLVEAGGLRLAALGTTEERLEGFVERPTSDLRAALLDTLSGPATRTTVTSENGR